jgi:hypothetical protein
MSARESSVQASGDHQGQVGDVDTRQSLTAGNGPQGPGGATKQSWYYGTVCSTSDFLARPCWHRAGSEPSLVVGFGQVSCLMVASLR